MWGHENSKENTRNRSKFINTWINSLLLKIVILSQKCMI